jgi:hypothetical protein
LINLDSLRIIVLSGVHKESRRSPHRVQEESTRSSGGVHKDLHGVQEDLWGSVKYSKFEISGKCFTFPLHRNANFEFGGIIYK